MSDNDCFDEGYTYITSPTFPAYSTLAGYTAELREFFDQYYVAGMTTSTLIEAGRTHLFDFSYPMYDDGVKPFFERKIIRNFFFRGIGFDNFDIFKFRLENWLNLNMPYYNKLYLSAEMENETSPLENMHNTETFTKTTHKDNTIGVDNTKIIDGGSTLNRGTNSTDNKFNRDIVSNTPDTRLNLTTGEDGSGMTGIIEYASQIDENKSIDKFESAVNDETTINTTDTITGTTTVNGTDTVTFTRELQGKDGGKSYAQLMKEYRENILRVDKMLYSEMNELFSLLY